MKVLFVCVHNSARSQMAEAFLNRLGKGVSAESAGLEPGVLNPLAVNVMSEIGYDISNNKVKDIRSLYEAKREYDIVITVCDPQVAEKCPFFPSQKLSLNWNFKDPSKLTGSYEEKLNETRAIRDEIKQRIEEFIRVFNFY
ncbi:MAG: arsenate reductase ArsC [Methanosarcinaceae archaeon]|nr:arsenate reductase ArsC [Methanosarcinaceae archaeon]